MIPDNPWTQGPLVAIIRFLAMVGLITIFGLGLMLGIMLSQLL